MPIAVHRKVELRRDYLYKRVHVKPDYLNTYICFSSSPFLLLVSSLLFLELFTKCNILRIYASCLNGFVLGSKWHHQYRMFCSICYSDFASFPYALLRSIGDITEVRIITATRAAYTSCCIIPDVNPIQLLLVQPRLLRSSLHLLSTRMSVLATKDQREHHNQLSFQTQLLQL